MPMHLLLYQSYQNEGEKLSMNGMWCISIPASTENHYDLSIVYRCVHVHVWVYEPMFPINISFNRILCYGIVLLFACERHSKAFALKINVISCTPFAVIQVVFGKRVGSEWCRGGGANLHNLVSNADTLLDWNDIRELLCNDKREQTSKTDTTTTIAFTHKSWQLNARHKNEMREKK